MSVRQLGVLRHRPLIVEFKFKRVNSRFDSLGDLARLFVLQD